MKTDGLTDEEKAIAAFLEVHFDNHGMRAALAMLRDPQTKVEDIRTVIENYRELYQRERH